ncbi:S41 family peptidase [Ectobacillus polymachus]|uniref:S41 family peptidase n=1 Tax=Ectobacillus polymachus TaxID=1508806 RepID=UPI003A8B632E
MVVAFLVGAGVMYAGMQYSYNKSYAGILSSKSNSPTKEADLQKIRQAYDLIDSRYVSNVDDTKLVEGAIQGMISTLKDPYSTYMDKATSQQFVQSLDSSMDGIGAEINKVDNKLIIVSPIKDSPAEKAGIKPNDEIISVNGESVKDKTREEAVLKIRGKKGTVVTLEVKRPNVDTPLTFKITRDTIPLYTVSSSVKTENGKNIGYLQISSFSENTAKEFKDKLTELEKKNINGLVIDVRGNPGGYLNSVEDILKLFITDNKPMVQVEDRNGKIQKTYSPLKERKPYPIDVLVDNGSASASEILAGAMKEAGGYPIVGVKSFGKGTVQQAVPLPDGSTIKLTMFKWLTPDGNWIHTKGIDPTVEVKQPDYYYATPIQFQNSLSYNMNNDQVKNAQLLLKDLGFEPGRTDGYFSKETETAVKAFQQSSNMDQTGIIDQKTADALQNKIIDKIRSGENDIQLQTALKLVAK